MEKQEHEHKGTDWRCGHGCGATLCWGCVGLHNSDLHHGAIANAMGAPRITESDDERRRGYLAMVAAGRAALDEVQALPDGPEKVRGYAGLYENPAAVHVAVLYAIGEGHQVEADLAQLLAEAGDRPTPPEGGSGGGEWRSPAPPPSNLVRTQYRHREFRGEDESGAYRLVLVLRYDDDCGNGHNTFAITFTLYRRGGFESGGCIMEGGEAYGLIKRHAPELLPLLRYHLWSTDGPLHYLANTTYLAGRVEYHGGPKESELDKARHTAAWLDGTEEELTDKGLLAARLPLMLHEFKAAMEALGFAY